MGNCNCGSTDAVEPQAESHGRRLPRRGGVRATLAIGALGLANVLGVAHIRKVHAATYRWYLSVPRTDYVTTSWHSTASKYLDINDCLGTICMVKVDSNKNQGTFGRVAFDTPTNDCGINPGARKKITFTLYRDVGTDAIATGLAQHITAGTWTAGTKYTSPETVGYISLSGSPDPACDPEEEECPPPCWTGSHVHFGSVGMDKSGTYATGFSCSGTTHKVYYSPYVSDGQYPWHKDIQE